MSEEDGVSGGYCAYDLFYSSPESSFTSGQIFDVGGEATYL